MTLAPGHYKARAIEGDFGVAGTGTKQIAVLFEVTEGDLRGERITWYGYFTSATAERTIESLRHCGCTFPNDSIDDLDGLTANEVGLVVEEEREESGVVRPRVRWVNRLGGGVALGSRMTAAEKRSFAEEMRGHVMAARQKAGAGSGAPTSPQKPASPPMHPAPAPARAATPKPRGSMNGTRTREPGEDDIPY